MSEQLEQFHQLINKKLTGEISQLEEIKFQKFIQQSSDYELHFRRMKDAWDEGQFNLRIKGQQSTFKRISRQLDFEENIFTEVTQPTSITWNYWYRVAAVFIFLFAAVSIFYFKNNSSDNSVRLEQTKMVIKNNPSGQKTRINLPDGSVCWLNSDSNIQFLTNFSDSARDVYLVGEAYFEVAKDENKPFRVYASTMMITATGTIFNVTSFPDDQMETVALIEGGISVNCEDVFYEKVLPGEAISFNKSSKTSDRFSIDAGDVIAWKNGILIFNEESYQTVFGKLERWYGVNISVNGKIPGDLKFKGTFPNELLSNVLNSLSYGHEFEFKINGKNVEIMFNKKAEAI